MKAEVKNKIAAFVLTGILFGVSACGAKKDAKPASSSPTVSATPPASSEKLEDDAFVVPQSAKKQAKYFPEGSPTRAIQDLDDMLDSYITDAKTPDDIKYNERLKRAVLKGTFDIRELCRLALDKHWTTLSEKDQNDFVSLMTNLLEKKAIFSKEQGQKKKQGAAYKVTYTGQKFLDKEGTTALSTSKVFVPSENLTIGLNYKLKREDKNWKVYDVVVDDASLLENYRYQFDKIIQKEGYTGLVNRMQNKFQQLEQKAAPQAS